MTIDGVKFSTDTQVSYNNKKLDIKAGTKMSSVFNIEINEEIQALMAKDGNKEDLTYEDMQYANMLIGKFGIKNVKKDGNAKVATLVFENGEEMKFNFNANLKKTQEVDITKEVNKKKIYNDLQKMGDCGISELYEVTVSEDGQYYEITVNTPWYMPDPKIITIAQDFGLKDYWTLFNENMGTFPLHRPRETRHEKYGHVIFVTDDRNVVVDNGTKFKLPVESVNIKDDANGFWGRTYDRCKSYGYTP